MKRTLSLFSMLALFLMTSLSSEARFVGNNSVNRVDYLGLLEIKMESNAFIPGHLGKWLPEPGAWIGSHQYKTDERGFGGGSSRIKVVIKVNSEKVGKLTRADVDVETFSSGSHRRWLQGPPWNRQWTGKDFKTAKVSKEIEFVSNITDKENNKCSLIQVNISGGYPYNNLAPDIDLQTHWRLCRCASEKSSIPGGWTTVTVLARHDAFPNYESLIMDEFVGGYATSDTGPGANLITWPGSDNSFFPWGRKGYHRGGRSLKD